MSMYDRIGSQEITTELCLGRSGSLTLGSATGGRLTMATIIGGWQEKPSFSRALAFWLVSRNATSERLKHQMHDSSPLSFPRICFAIFAAQSDCLPICQLAP